MKLFDYIKALTTEKLQLSDEDLVSYDPFIINRAFGMNKGTVTLANEINMGDISKRANSDFWKNILPQQFIKLKWCKAGKNEHKEIIETLAMHYNTTTEKVIMYIDILSDDDIQLLMDKYHGKNK